MGLLVTAQKEETHFSNSRSFEGKYLLWFVRQSTFPLHDYVVQLLIYDVDLGMQLCQKSVVCPKKTF